MRFIFNKLLKYLKINIAFLRTLIILFSFMLIFVSISMYTVYTSSKNLISKEVSLFNENTLNNIKEYVDSNFLTLHRNLYALSIHTNLQYLLYNDDNYSYRWTNTIPFFKELSAFKFNNKNVVDIFVYFIDNDYLLTSQASYEIDFYFDKMLHSDSITLDEWNDRLNNPSLFDTVYLSNVTDLTSGESTSHKYLVQLISFPILSNTPRAVVGAILNVNSITNQISAFDKTMQNNYFVVDKNDNLIFQSGQKLSLSEEYIDHMVQQTKNKLNQNPGKGNFLSDDGNVYVNYMYSNDTNWLYISAVPYIDIESSAEALNRTLFNVLTISFFIILIFSWFFSRFLFSPIRKMVKNIISKADFPAPHTNEFDIIKNEFDNLRLINEKSANYIKFNESYIKENLVYRLLNGIAKDPNELIDIFNDLGLIIAEGYSFIVVTANMFNIDNPYPENTSYNKQTILRDTIYNILAKNSKVYYSGLDLKSASYLIYSPGNISDIKNRCDIAVAFMNDQVKQYKISIGIGDPRENPEDIPASFRESIEALENLSINTESDCFCYSIKNIYENPPSTNKVNTLLHKDDLNEALEVSISLMNTMVQRKYPYKEFTLYVSKLINLAISLAETQGCKLSKEDLEKIEEFQKAEVYHTPEDYNEHIRWVYAQININLNQNIQTRKDEYIHYIYKYVMTNFTKNIGLDNIASELNVSANYLSQFFKKNTGISFPQYINTVRIQQAKQLLKETDKHIEDISLLVGFYSVNSFTRVFKSIVGMTPSEYR